uniref:SH3 domain-containing protein n=1 Tax=Romanomermis culicivorax TaxID=13658 RepID=A0A915K4B6_ROMCU
MATSIEQWDIIETDKCLTIGLNFSTKFVFSLSDEALTFVAVSNFEPNFVDGLPLLIGDSISVERSCEDWLYGSLNGRFGVFPRACVKYVPCKNNDETTSAMISEINRYHDVTKRLELIIKDLIHWRKQILSGKLPVEELSVLKKKIGVKIDVGNKLLDLDMVLRNDDGELADIDSCSLLELYQLHCSTLEKIQSDNKRGHISKEGLHLQQNGGCCCFLLCLHDIFLRVNSDAEIFISLYDSQHNCYISLCKLLRELFTSYVPLLNDDERYGSRGSLSSVVKRSSGVFQGYKVLFTDFERKNFDGRRIFLVCKVIKFGAFESGTLPRKATNTAVRQPYAVGVVDLSEIIKTPSKSFDECLIDGFSSSDECDTHIYMPLLM